MSRDVRGACALYYSYQVRGADGTIKVPFRRRTAHSFVIAYVRFLYLKFLHPANQTVTDTGGTGRIIGRLTFAKISAASGTSTAGLVVGTGTTAVAFTNTALVTQIAHGVAATQLQYGACTIALPSSDSTSTSLIHTRVFSNASGGTITINEIAMYAKLQGIGGNETNHCIVRDLATITLTNGDQLTLNYIFKTTS